MLRFQHDAHVGMWASKATKKALCGLACLLPGSTGQDGTALIAIEDESGDV